MADGGAVTRDRLLALAARRVLKPLRGRRAHQLREDVAGRRRRPRRGSSARPSRGPLSMCGGRSGRKRTGWRAEERGLVAREHDEQAARPGPGRRHPRGEPRRGQAEGGVEAEPPLELVLDGLGGGHRARAARSSSRREVDVGLVGGGPLDPAAGGEQDRRHVLAEARVGRRGRRAGRRRPGRPGGRRRWTGRRARRRPAPRRWPRPPRPSRPGRAPTIDRAVRAGRDRGSARPRRGTGRGRRAGCGGSRAAPSQLQCRGHGRPGRSHVRSGRRGSSAAGL